MPPAPSAETRAAPSPLGDHAAYLGPEGTFSEEALLSSARPDAVQPLAVQTIRDAVMAVHEGSARWALVPIENSIEGSVTTTLDTLTGEAGDVSIVGEAVLPVRHFLIAHHPVELERIGTILSHPHVPGQCTRFLHEQLPHARIAAAASTAEAVRAVAERGDPGWAAIGTRLAAEIYGCTVLSEGIQDREDNQTRFAWLALGEAGEAPAPPLRLETTAGASKTSIVFWGPGADRAGWLVLCLDEFGKRGINLTKIESRPRRERLGHYMFFVDLEGALQDEPVSQALAGLGSVCEQVRVLGSYPAAG